MGKNPPASAGDTGSIPGLGQFHLSWNNKAHAPQLLSPRCRACQQLLNPACSGARSHNYWAPMLQLRKPTCCRASKPNYGTCVLQPLKSELRKTRHHNEKPTHHTKAQPPQLEKARGAQWQRPSASKINIKKKKPPEKKEPSYTVGGNVNCCSHGGEQYCCCLVAKSYPTLCNPMDWSTPGFPVLHSLPEFAPTHVHCGDDAIQPSHPLSPPSPPALNQNIMEVP